MKLFRRYVLPLALLFVVAGAVRGIAGTTLTGQLTIPSGTLVQPGAILNGQALRIGESITNSFDPRVSGLDRVVGSLAYSRSGALAFIKTNTPPTSWERILPGSIGGAGTAAGITTARAQFLIGPSLGLTCFRDDFVYNPSGAVGAIYTSLSGGTGSFSPSTTSVGGQETATTGATANSTALLATNATVFGAPASNRFYFAARMAVTSAIDANTFAIVGLQVNGFAQDIAMGVCGNSSTANYVVQYDGTDCAGTLTPTSVAYTNGTFHVFELWGIGSAAFRAAIDGIEVPGSPFTQLSAPAGALRLMFDLRNGVTAATRTLSVDWFHACWIET